MEKKGKVRRDIVNSTFEKGGLEMIDVASHIKALKCSWVSRLCDDTFASWKVLPCYWFNKIGNFPLVFLYNVNKRVLRDMVNSVPPFIEK